MKTQGKTQGKPQEKNLELAAFRLRPGEDLKTGLESFVRDRKWRAAFVVTCVGSLNFVTLRFANQPAGEKLTGPFEIVSLVGTLGAQGAHIHLSVSDSKGQTIGGHLLSGSSIYTTAEIVLGEATELDFCREPCELSGYRELSVKARGVQPPAQPRSQGR